jgi:hypothetical protein
LFAMACRAGFASNELDSVREKPPVRIALPGACIYRIATLKEFKKP